MAKIMSKKSYVEKNISMSAQSPLHLTEGQKACLRLVVQHHTSKEIARALGISPFTVDQRLDAARRKLNATSRIDAAKIFDIKVNATFRIWHSSGARRFPTMTRANANGRRGCSGVHRPRSQQIYPSNAAFGQSAPMPLRPLYLVDMAALHWPWALCSTDMDRQGL